MQKTFEYSQNGESYIVCVTYKFIKNIIFRYRNGRFVISAPYLTSKGQIIENLTKFYPRLIKEKSPLPSPIDENGIYLFGNIYPILQKSDGEKEVVGHFSFRSDDDLKKQLKRLLIEEITPLVRSLEQQMSIDRPYRLRISEMKTRYGTNSKKTHTIAIEYHMVHFDPAIINSLLIHELAHDKYFDHSKIFYDYVLKFCPDYRDLHKKLRKRVFR